MKKLYAIFSLLFIAFHFASFAGSNKVSARKTGTIIIQLDAGNYTGLNINQLHVIFDKYDRTGAGIIDQTITLDNGVAVVNDVPEGKYFVDVYTAGAYHRHFSTVMKAGNKTSKYKLVLDAVVYLPAHASDEATVNNATANNNSAITEEAIVAKN